MLSQEMETSLFRRILQLVCAIIWCLLSAGPVFGFAALKPVLISEGVYKEYCSLNDNFLEIDEPCPEQDLKLNFIFTIAAVVTNVTFILVGTILDHYGPRVTGIIGSIFLFCASLILRKSDTITIVDGYLFGYTLLAFAGPFVFISCLQLSNSFPRQSGLILALLTGAFDASCALFLIYRIIYQGNYIKNLTFEKFFTFYLIVPIFIFVCQMTIMPHSSYKTINTIAKISEEQIDENGFPIDEEIDPNETTSLIQASQSNKTTFELQREFELATSSGGVFGVCHNLSLMEQFKSSWFILMCAFTAIQMLRINYFVATIRSQEEYLFNPEIGLKINRFFDLALPIGGIISIPFIGILLDHFQTLTVLNILTVISVIIGILGILKLQICAYSGIILLVLYRPFYYTTVSDYCSKVFGFHTFGTIYGSIICFCGFTNLLQTLLDHITHFTFKMNPIPVNIALTAITGVAGFSLIAFIISQEREIIKRQMILEAENAVIIDMPH
ncbi:hypothetical protein PACTADRAFT_35899 [Pachysolen tannophilus NRRL Y-2460]|uniref:Protein FMP42 n=1 Tax=Pachysolen tannophilus NRRL Y-2460 TaxID=669874 RepID=A0A1E4TNG0_PACTA|nr:hypothetical protein PACTADRAFT_35899 [Pachysolen tannophilus NRRL Y-2460]